MKVKSDCLCLTEKYARWLMPSDPSTNYNNAIKQHHSDTGSWLLEHDMYKDWKEKPNSFMWIHGIRECMSNRKHMSFSGHLQLVQEKQSFCKSHISLDIHDLLTLQSSTIVQDIELIAQKGSIGLAYFYCDVSDSQKRNAFDILSSLVINLLSWEPQTQSVLEKAYDDCRNGVSKPPNDRLLEVLKQFISGFKMAYILIDALDECLKVREILDFIQTLYAWNLDQCHLLVTSRKEPQIVDFMRSIKLMEVDMSQMPVDNDIKKYIEFVLQSSPDLGKWNENEKVLIRDALFGKAKGM